VAELKIGFDLGAQPWDFMSLPRTFISHSHLDHIAAIPAYVARRRMMKMERPTLYLPDYAMATVDQMLKVFRSLTVLKQKYPQWLTVWPDDAHIFYRPVDRVEPWIREDQMNIYKAFMNYQPMPYE
jgi:ribonuclease BN (tRNA processing enzyme)